MIPRAVQALEVSPTMQASKMTTSSLSSTFFVTQAGQEVSSGRRNLLDLEVGADVPE